jgi:hypothetical protein
MRLHQLRLPFIRPTLVRSRREYSPRFDRNERVRFGAE